MKKKKYRVSIPIETFVNYEIEISAQSEKDAFDMALDRYHKGEYNDDNITDPDIVNARIDDSYENAHIEEVE
jgi:hypothetical protein